MIPVLTVAPTLAPNPAPLFGNLELGVTPAYAGGFQSIITGASIGGSSVVFSQLYGLAAFLGRGGVLVMPSYGGRFGGSLRGSEDLER